MNKQIEAYLKQIERSLFTCPKKKRISFLRDFRGDLNAYMQEHPQASIQELMSTFGTPDAIAEDFLQSTEFARTKKVLSTKRKIVRTVLIAVCTLIAATIILGTIYVVDVYKYTHGFWVEEPAQKGHSILDPDALESY